MTGPGDEIAAAAGRRGHLRASHADRERAIDVLKAAFVQGALAKDEFDLRVGRALASRTYMDLAALTADIPGLTRAQRSPELRRESAHMKAFKVLVCVPAVFMSMFAAAVMAAGAADGGNPFEGLGIVVALAVFVSVVVVIPLAALLVFHAWLDRRASRQSSQAPPPSAGGRVSQCPAPPDSARHLPQISRDPRHTAEASRSRLPRRGLTGLRPSHRWRLLGRRYAIG